MMQFTNELEKETPSTIVFGHQYACGVQNHNLSSSDMPLRGQLPLPRLFRTYVDSSVIYSFQYTNSEIFRKMPGEIVSAPSCNLAHRSIPGSNSLILPSPQTDVRGRMKGPILSRTAGVCIRGSYR